MADKPPSAPVRALQEAETTNDASPGPAPGLGAAPAQRSDWLHRRFILTDMPTWLMLALVAVGLPRTILADLDIVAPESSLLYYILALTPFAVWLAVAVIRRSRRPFTDFLVLGVLYGLSLVVVHQLLWDVGPALGHHPPAGAVSFANQFGPPLHEVALRGYTIMIAVMIGLGTGLVVALVAVVANVVRSRRARRTVSAPNGANDQ
jgi:hypothetical protein